MQGERHPPPAHRTAFADDDGKVERFHRTLREEYLGGRVFASVAEAQAGLDAWVHQYNFERPHQSLGMAVPWDRFRLADRKPADPAPEGDSPAPLAAEPPLGATTTRRVGVKGTISFAAASYKAGVWLPARTSS